MKAICLSTEALNEMVSEIYGQECQVVLNEENDHAKEVIQWLGENKNVVKTTDFETILPLLGTSMNVEIENYDCMDLGELGMIGFVFFF